MVKKLLKAIGIFLGVVVIGIALFFGVLFLCKYNPEDIELISSEQTGKNELTKEDTIKLMTWNIGYGALGDNADFFMDGGKMVNTATKERVLENLADISKTVAEENPDIFLMQEVDVNSKRSSNLDELEYIQSDNTDYISTFAYNFKVVYVPFPFIPPSIGKVNGGIATFQKYSLNNSERIQLYCPFNKFVSAFNLRRCLLVNRIPVKDSDKELVIINLHLEAYDSGVGKTEQAKQLRTFLETEIEKGNYVIAGGDFNQVFSNIDVSKYPIISDDLWRPANMDVSELKGVSVITDATFPTCRSLDKVYKDADKASFQYYVIDGYIVSDNIEIQKVETINKDFVSTDHNPVILEVKLK